MSISQQTWINGLMLCISISLIQWHSIQFWMESAGTIGPLWSIAIEAAALWLWWQGRNVLACVASLVLIIGPLAYLALPVFEAQQKTKYETQQWTEQKRLLESSIAQLTASLDSYQTTSQSRIGWAARIDETQAALNEEQQKLANLIAETPTQHRYDLLILTVTIETLAISILVLTQILAIRALRNVSISKRPVVTVTDGTATTPIKPEESVTTSSKQLEITDNNYEEIVTTVSTQLAERLEIETISQAEWARRNGISAKSVSMLLNHSKRRAEGKECVSRNELRQLKLSLDEARG